MEVVKEFTIPHRDVGFGDKVNQYAHRLEEEGYHVIGRVEGSGDNVVYVITGKKNIG